MKKIGLVLILISMLIGCSERMTKQFIVPLENDFIQSKTVENWTINPPSLIAYKNKSVSQIPQNPNLYWLTVKAFSQENSKPYNNLIIDSVGLEFVGVDTILWRTPSRVAPFKKSNKNYIAFDFFKDQGIMIPESVSKIRLFFDAVIVANSSTSHKVSFNMIRQDTTQNTPFMIQ